MSYQHKELAAGRWKELSFVEQMANIGSELERALSWQARHNAGHCQKSFERTLELIDLSLECAKGFPRLKELCRLREVIVDYFAGQNQFMSTQESFVKYFSGFFYACRRGR